MLKLRPPAPPSDREKQVADLLRIPEDRVYGERRIREVVELWHDAYEGDDGVVGILCDYLEDYPPPEHWLYRTRLQVVSEVNRGRLCWEMPMVPWAMVEALTGADAVAEIAQMPGSYGRRPWPFPWADKVNVTVGESDQNTAPVTSAV